ncbi:hypothetical protein Ahy_A08g038361 [Arachis hypogaea]|uniref:Aminotransferase-like plant mobile domain-containing protein n=1 Tax=Arachis hypogaea TaxID=3818 RepID=A0A445BTK1_ARAHY|nr:hypothetical protein Ahy_A08g038361 [Arachis hypogaea]
MSGGGVNVEENLNRLDELHIAAHLFHKPTRVLTPHGMLVDVFMLEAEDPTMEIRRERLEPYLRRTGFYHASLIKHFEYDNPLISAFVERWRPETHTFHLPWGECTVTLEDVAMQLGLPVDGQPVSGVLLPDKANNTVHVRYLPLLAEYDAIGTYSWGSAVLCWLYRAMCLTTDYSVEGMAGCHTLLMSWIYYRLLFWAPNVTTPYSFPLATRHRLRLDNLQVDKFVWQPYLEPWILSRVLAEFLGHPHGDFYTAVVPLIFFRWIEILNVDRVLRQFGGKQGPPNPPLNIDTFHRQSARNDDGWWPVRLSEWFEVWANRRTDAYRLQIDRADTLRPSQDYYRWYSQRTRRFLSTPDALHDLRGDVVPADAPAEYSRGPVVNLPLVPRDHRRRRPRRVRDEGQAEHGEDEQDLPEQDRPSFEPDMGHHIPSHAPPAAGDYYYPQPVVSADPPSHLPFSKLCHIRVASRLGVHPREQSSPHTPTDLALALPRSDTYTQAAYAGMRSASVGDTAVSPLRPYDAM